MKEISNRIAFTGIDYNIYESGFNKRLNIIIDINISDMRYDKLVSKMIEEYVFNKIDKIAYTSRVDNTRYFRDFKPECRCVFMQFYSEDELLNFINTCDMKIEIDKYYITIDNRLIDSDDSYEETEIQNNNIDNIEYPKNIINKHKEELSKSIEKTINKLVGGIVLKQLEK